MFALVGEHDQLDLYPVTKPLIMVRDLWVDCFPHGEADLKGAIKALLVSKEAICLFFLCSA